MSNSILAIDIGTTSIISVLAQNSFTNQINILGVGEAKNDNSIQRGAIVDINKASDAIKTSIDTLKNEHNLDDSKVVVSISGVDTKGIRSNGSINITSGNIGENDIKQVLNMALYDANIIPEYDVIHVIPLYFRIDDGNPIANPLNTNGSRLEAYVYIVTTKKTYLNNIRNVLKKSDIEVDNFILASYASALSILTKDQKELGTLMIDLGGSCSQFSLFKSGSLIYSDIINIGSQSITNDLSVMLSTPYEAANSIKEEYGSLIYNDINNNINKIKTPKLGNESQLQEIAIKKVVSIIHARIEEILFMIKERLEFGDLIDTIKGIVITGGMSNTKGIDILSEKVFDNLPVKISTPTNIKNGYINLNNPIYSTVYGILIYSLYNNNRFELNSNKELNKPLIKIKINENDIIPKIERNISNNDNTKEILKSKEETKESTNILATVKGWFL